MGLVKTEELRWHDQIDDGFEPRDQTSGVVGRGLGCGEIGVGLAGFIGNRFDQNGGAKAARLDRQWV